MILASASPRRVELLKQLGITPSQIIPAELDETPLPNELPRMHVLRLAQQKAQAIAEHHPNETVLAADTVVALGRRILPKAEDEATARRCLELLSGRRHRVLTAVAVIDGTKKLRSKLSVSTVIFARLSETDIADYLASGEWRGKAGGYAIQGKAACFVRFVSGSYSGIVGLPLYETSRLLTPVRG